MKLGLIGLGKMGFNLALNMKDNNHDVIVYNRSAGKTKQAESLGLKAAYNLRDLIKQLPSPRVLWLMVSAGAAVDEVINALIPLLEGEDIIIDGGNSDYRDTIKRAEQLKEYNINYVDAGTSGGTSGARRGACMMVGAERKIFELLEPLFASLCVKDGYIHTGKNGSGHYVKMIHNGIEYGMLQAMAEGFEILNKSEFDLDYRAIAGVWNHGSVIRGWLMELMENAFSKDPELSGIKGVVDASGEGQWAVEEALRLNVGAHVIASSLFVRYRSHEDDTFSGKVIAALRGEFGGHKVRTLK